MSGLFRRIITLYITAIRASKIRSCHLQGNVEPTTMEKALTLEA